MNQNKALHSRLKRLEALTPNRMVFLVQYLQDNGEVTEMQLNLDEIINTLDRERIKDIRCIGGNDLDDLDRYLDYLVPNYALN